MQSNFLLEKLLIQIVYDALMKTLEIPIDDYTCSNKVMHCLPDLVFMYMHTCKKILSYLCINL